MTDAEKSTRSSDTYVIPFAELRMTDVHLVGGKNASLGEMISQLQGKGVRVPGGFATTSNAYRDFLSHSVNGQDTLAQQITALVAKTDLNDVRQLAESGSKIRQLIIDTPLPPRLEKEITDAYESLVSSLPDGVSFAVRSSATAEDLEDASFAGQQETFLNIFGIENLMDAVKHVFASLYNDRAISYREHRDFKHEEVALSVGVQQMVRSDIGSSGVMFTLDTESGFRDVVFITSSYGLGEAVVQGAVNPDEYYVHKPMLEKGKKPIIRRSLGHKPIQMVFSKTTTRGKSVETIEVSPERQLQYSLEDEDIMELARFGIILEEHYGRPMDIEWGKDGIDGWLYILQARPETVKSQQKEGDAVSVFRLMETGKLLATGRAVGQKIGIGPVRVIKNASEMFRVEEGDVLVADMTDPNWEPVMKKAAAVVTNRGGRTCHAAIVAREIGVPAVVGATNATNILKDGMIVTVSCSEGDEGRIYEGALKIDESRVVYDNLDPLPIKMTMNIGNPSLAFENQAIPNDGVGLARLEFIINEIGIHPQAALAYPNVDDKLKNALEVVSRGYPSPREYYVDKVSEGVATIAAAFWPKPVIVRLSDFKSNEYRSLIGGSRYEPEEENPMLGFRGAVRYLSKEFAEAFRMECEALLRVRNDMGLTNVEIMVPFVRTINQAKAVLDLLAGYGLARGQNGLRIIMMAELPSNAILAEEFLELFDGISIGSNDLTQLTLGLDRDSGIDLLVEDFDERDPAVLALISRVIKTCNAKGKYVGICGQGPSDRPDFAHWLIKEGIGSLSLNPDSVLPTWKNLTVGEE